MPTDAERLREQLAAVEHERWAHWQRYMHSLCPSSAVGDRIIPSLLVERWERQIATPYADLSEAEKASDREQVDRYWPLIEPLLAEVERLRNEAKALRNDEDFDPSPIITEYDRVVAENAALHQEILRLRAGHADLAAMHAEAVARLGYDPNRPLAEWEQQLLDEQARVIAAERDVIEAARAWRAAFPTHWADIDLLGRVHNNLITAVDALPQPAPQAGADLHMTVRQAEEGGDG